MVLGDKEAPRSPRLALIQTQPTRRLWSRRPEPASLEVPSPKVSTPESSGTIIVPRDHPRVELKEGDDVFVADDARAMSSRRRSQDLEKMGQEARAQLNEHVPVPPPAGGSLASKLTSPQACHGP
jgi:hypothetical protein